MLVTSGEGGGGGGGGGVGFEQDSIKPMPKANDHLKLN